eukprot:Nk52_evm62s554 gene=Nk52_evmTU62s554
MEGHRGTNRQIKEFHEELDKARPRGKKGQGRRKKAEPTAANRLRIGAANLAYSRSNYDEVIEICEQVMDDQPECSDPYYLLGMVYDDKGDKYRYMVYTSHALDITGEVNVDARAELGDIALEHEHWVLAAHNFSRVLKEEPKNVEFLDKHIVACEKLGKEQKVIENLKKILEQRPDHASALRRLAMLYYERNETEKGAHYMTQVIGDSYGDASYDDINILCDMYEKQNRFQDVYNVVSKKLETEEKDLSSEADLQNVRKDIVGRLCVASIMLAGDDRSSQPFGNICSSSIAVMLNRNSSQSDERLYRVALALIAMDSNDDAVKMLLKIENKSPDVLKSLAECYYKLDELKLSCKFYEMALEHLSDNKSVRIGLSIVYQRLNQSPAKSRQLLEGLGDDVSFQEGLAMAATSTKNNYAKLRKDYLIQTNLNLKALIHLCEIVLAQGCYEEYLGLSTQLLRAYFAIRLVRKTFPPRDLSSVGGFFDPDNSQLSLVRQLKINESCINIDSYEIMIVEKAFENIRPGNWKSLLENTCKLLRVVENYTMIFEYLCFVIPLNLFDDYEFCVKLKYIFADCCYQLGHYKCGFEVMRKLFYYDGNVNLKSNIHFWVLLNKFSCRERGAYRQVGRAIIRTYQKREKEATVEEGDKYLAFLAGNSALEKKNYKRSKEIYLKYLKFYSNKALPNLCISLSYLHLTTQRSCGERHKLLAKCLVFILRYSFFRKGYFQEIYFNLGRLFHSVRLLPLAIYYYNRALNSPSGAKVKHGEKKYAKALDDPNASDNSDIRREIAFNLSAVYRDTGQLALFRNILLKYCIV